MSGVRVLKLVFLGRINGDAGGWGGASSKLHRVIRDRAAKTSQILVEPHLIDAEFREAWMPFFLQVLASGSYGWEILGFC